jgi:hypothetical protein
MDAVDGEARQDHHRDRFGHVPPHTTSRDRLGDGSSRKRVVANNTVALGDHEVREARLLSF